MENLEELIRERDRLDERIKALKNGAGRFRITYERRPNSAEKFMRWHEGKNKIEPYDRYVLQVKYKTIKGRERWEPVYAAGTRAEVVAEIPKIIESLRRALESYQGDQDASNDPVAWIYTAEAKNPQEGAE